MGRPARRLEAGGGVLGRDGLTHACTSQNGQDFSRAIESFSQALRCDAATGSWCDAQPQLAGALTKFGQTLAQLQEFQDVLFITLDSTFIRPLGKFVKEVSPTHHHRTACLLPGVCRGLCTLVCVRQVGVSMLAPICG